MNECLCLLRLCHYIFFRYYVRLGDFDLSRTDEASHVDLVVVNHTNPGYSTTTHRDDISILTLERDVEFNGEFVIFGIVLLSVCLSVCLFRLPDITLMHASPLSVFVCQSVNISAALCILLLIQLLFTYSLCVCLSIYLSFSHILGLAYFVFIFSV